LLEKLDPRRRGLALGFGPHRFDYRGVMTESRDDACHYGVAIVAATVKEPRSGTQNERVANQSIAFAANVEFP